jgi:hypothetical protein
MGPDPTTQVIALAVSSIRSLFGSYQAYQTGKIKETDEGLRDDIRRRLTMIRSHIVNIETRAVDNSEIKLMKQAGRVRSVLDRFSSDIKMGISGSVGSSHIQAETVSRKQIKKLIEHDKNILERLVKLTNIVNLAESHSANSSAESIPDVSDAEQLLTSIMNRYLERQTLLGGIE